MEEVQDIDFKKFAENARKIKKVKIDFEYALNAEIFELEGAIKKLFSENEQIHIFNEISKLDINTISVPKIGRFETILNYVSQEYLNKYKINFISNNSLKELVEPPVRPEDKTKEVIEKFNKELKEWQLENNKIKDWNTKYSTLTEFLEVNDRVDLYGDTTLNVSNMPYIYFKFFNTDIDEIEVFIQELKTCPAPPVKNIKSVKIEDISSLLPTFLKSANEVRVYLNTDAEAEELHGSKDYVEGVYEKYVIKNDTMRKDGGEWGLYNQRKGNLTSPVLGNFSLNNLTTPVNLNSGDIEEEEEDDFHKDDYEVALSECYYSKVENNEGDILYAIVPKDFWDIHECVLINKNMFISGISDNKKWRKSDIYFKFLGYESDANEYLEAESDYSEELNNYINENSNELYGEEDVIDSNYLTSEPKDCFWVIDYLDDNGEFILNVIPKKYWEDKKDVYQGDLNFKNKLIDGYVLRGSYEEGYSLYDKSDNSATTLKIINLILSKSGFTFSNEIQKEYCTESLNGKRVFYKEDSDEEFFKNATIEFSEYLYNLDSDESEVE